MPESEVLVFIILGALSLGLLGACALQRSKLVLLKEQHESVCDEIPELQQRIESLLSEQGHMRSAKESVEHNLAQMELRLNRYQDIELEKHEVEKQLKQFEERQEQTQAQLKESKERLSQLNAKLDQLNSEYLRLSEQHVKLESTSSERDRNHREQIAQFDQQKVALAKEFENLANKIFDEKGQSFKSSSQESLESMLKPFREQITEFRRRVDVLQKESSESNVGLHKELEHLRKLNQEIAGDAKNLTSALKGDKKKTGNWGEVQLEKTLQLAGLVKGDHYDSQVHFKNMEGKTNYPDFVVNLPDDKHIVIDSKVSLVDYDQAIAADSDEMMEAALKEHGKSVKKHIDDLSAKDYSNLIGIRSPSFVLMFMPIEPAYIEALRHNNDLFNYGYQKGVILVSHTTLMPILRTVANLWAMEQSHAEVRAISDKAGDVFNQVCVVAERLHKLGATLASANNHYNSTVKALAGQQGLYGKVNRFSQLSNKATKNLPELESMHVDLDVDRLEVVRQDIDLIDEIKVEQTVLTGELESNDD